LDNAPVSKKVDYRLLGSALARVRWELDVNPRWQRDPTFYVEQTVVALEEAFLPPPPIDETRWREIMLRAENIPAILQQAKANLKPIAPFARLAIASLEGVDGRFTRLVSAVNPLLQRDDERARFSAAMTAAGKAFIDYREWLSKGLPAMRQ